MAGYATPPSVNELSNYDVNNSKQVEVIRQPLYDYQSYAAAGTLNMNFFQVPQGAGSTTAPGASGTKTESDTNMELAGQLPAGQNFLVTGIMVMVWPGNKPNATGALTTSGLNWQDMYDLGKSGVLKFSVGSKNQLVDGPLSKFPPNFGIGGSAAMADATTAAAALHSQIDYAKFAGAVYGITPVRLIPTQNFKVTINWPALVAINSGARIGVILDGWLYRWAQ